MTTPGSDTPRPILTAAERARLRPTVDAEALERFLDAIPEEVRLGVQRAAVLHFSRDVTMADIRDFLSDVGNDDAAAAMDRAIEKDRAIAAEPPRSELEVPTTPGGLADQAAPADRVFSMDPPESPRLRALWDAIEPPPPAAG
jgi:hypothetical protein